MRALRARRGVVEPADRVVGLSAQAISQRFAPAAHIAPRLTAHSGRVGLAARGPSAHAVMRAGNWTDVRMVDSFVLEP